MLSKGQHQTVPLSVLLKRELASEKVEKPEICHGQASQSKKGEDFTLLKTECQRILGDGVTTYSVFGVCLSCSFLMFLDYCGFICAHCVLDYTSFIQLNSSWM